MNNPSGMLSVRLADEDWRAVIALKHHQEQEGGRPVSVTDIIKEVLRDAAARCRGDKPAPAGPAPSASPPVKPCVVCNGITGGTDYRCLACGRGLGNESRSEELFVAKKVVATSADGEERLYAEQARKPTGKKTKVRRRY